MGPKIGDVGAEIGERPHAEAQELPVGIQRQRRPGQMVACLGVAEKTLGAAAQPAHRQPQLARRPGHQDLLVIGEVLHAEAAAEVVREDAQAVFFDPENAGDDGARAVHVLAVDVEGVALARGIVDAERTARLDGTHDQAVVDQFDLHDMGGGPEGSLGGVGVALCPRAGEVARRLRPNLRRARLARLRRVDHRRQRCVLHTHELRRILRGGERPRPRSWPPPRRRGARGRSTASGWADSRRGLPSGRVSATKASAMHGSVPSPSAATSVPV